jgi:hypothetical protein
MIGEASNTDEWDILEPPYPTDTLTDSSKILRQILLMRHNELIERHAE